MDFEDRYVLEEPLGPCVWRARDRLGGTCVIKRRDPAMPLALEREHAELVRLDHHGIRRLLGAGSSPERYLVLEHVDGLDPRAHVNADPNALRRVAIDVLRALLHLHEHDRVHGDLKPENLIVSGSTRLIDLGLCVPVGARLAGGTGGYLAPELLRGGPASVASDLFALGKTLLELGGAPEHDLRRLIEGASSPDPGDRPASAVAALAMLGELPHPEDRGALPWEGDGALAAAAAFAERGGTWVMEAPSGAGRSRMAEELMRDAAQRWIPAVHLSTRALSARFGGAGTLAERCLRGSRALGNLRVVLDNDGTSEDERRAVLALARGHKVSERGVLLVMGAAPALANTLEREGATVHGLAPLCREQVASLLSRAGARSPDTLVEALTVRTRGRAGRAAEAALWLAAAPERSDEEVLQRAGWETPDAMRPRSSGQAIAWATEALEAGTPHRAAWCIEQAVDEPTRHAEAGPLLARAWFEAGRLEAAHALYAHFEPAADRLTRARLAARLGRHEEVLSLVDPVTNAEGDVLYAASALALGRMKELHERIERGLERGDSASMRARLLLVRSDAALRSHDPVAAMEDARSALAIAGDDLAQAARAEGRLGSAYALSGDPHRALLHQRRALRAVEEAGDVGALPSYVINVAVAEHATGDLGAALRRYEEGARLAKGLGRVGMQAAAEVNRAGLLVHLGARDEAERVLADAQQAAERAGAEVYVAQARLIEAERVAPSDPDAAVEHARHARAAFDACGAVRQALEARLLVHEIRRGDAADAFAAMHEDTLAAAGLETRALLLRAEVALSQDRTNDAATLAEDALERARDGSDAELEARAWAFTAQVHRHTGSVDASRRTEMATATLARVAERLPAGLRERFLADRADWAQPPTSSRPLRSGALGDGGRRLLLLMRRVLLDGDERRVLEAAVDEAIALTRAERAFLLQTGDAVRIARNLDRATIHRGQFSRSAAERVLETGEPLMTQMATSDPALAGARSVADLGLRSILCVPIRSREEVVGALYLDHRFESARFGDDDLELVSALADIIGLALENGRLHREAAARARELERTNREVRDQNRVATERLAELEQRLANTVDAGETAGIVGTSRSIRHALAVARRVAPSDLSVLIEGESGTGKELFARFVHDESRRREEPFLALNCGALPETLLESELFGHVRGAFTGATRDHPGLFRTTRGGTLLLDEIGEMPLRMQVRLLRVLQEREVRPLGSTRSEPVDVRIIAATHRHLDRDVEAGRFRQDLYFRLVGVRLTLPPLRERRDDIPGLVERLLDRIAAEPGMRAVTLSRAAMGALLLHDWPGNVRELEQALRRGILIGDGDILGPDDLALAFGQVVDRASALRTFDRGLVERALSAAGGNKSKAARTLGVSRPTLYRWIKRYDLS
ncbi:MAG: sigma 54-interacting transcriptional regulator [Sandaracinaceae bacterium]